MLDEEGGERGEVHLRTFDLVMGGEDWDEELVIPNQSVVSGGV